MRTRNTAAEEARPSKADPASTNLPAPSSSSRADDGKITTGGARTDGHDHEATQNLPPPAHIAREIVEDLRAALEQFESVAADLGE
jgi:hypothetical protein